VPEAAPTKPSANEVDSMRWYHTIELGDGVVTPGEYDLRPIVPRLPLPESLAGKRCIDLGSRDGFYAFEMERRGASEVVSIDLDDPDEIAMPASAPANRDAIAEELEVGNRAFETARRALGSNVRRELVSIYALDPDAQGRFDFAVLGSLLLHLRDPVGALTGARRVIDGRLLIVDAVAVSADLLRRRPVAQMHMQGAPFWWMCNIAGLRRMAEAAGFRVLDSSRPFFVPPGPRPLARRGLRGPLRTLPRRLIDRRGALHAWLLAEAA
jgi:tRNA (mo5U34)-methyltransferase